jgi:hypothetical protein
MYDDSRLKQMARIAIDGGRVPRTRSGRPWGSSGDGSECPICDRPIISLELGYELEHCERGVADLKRSFLVHARCFRAWDAVRDLTDPAHATSFIDGGEVQGA